MILRHAQMQIGFKGEYTGIREMRKHAAWYTAVIKIPPVSVQKSVKWKIMSSFRHYLKRYWHIIIKICGGTTCLILMHILGISSLCSDRF